MKHLATIGRSFFALGVIGSGIQQLVRADFVRLVPKLPAWIPGQPILACVVGIALVVAGAAMLAGYRASSGALAVAGLLLVTFVFQRIPEIVSNPWVGFMWTNPSKVLALWGGAIIVAGSPGLGGAGHWPGRLRPLGAYLLAVFLAICGSQHFVYADFVDTLVPAWLPQPRFWTLFTGTCLMAGGVGMAWARTARWAATLSGVMVFLWVLMLHIPRAIALSRDPGETAAIFEALAISGVAFLVAGLRDRRVESLNSSH